LNTFLISNATSETRLSFQHKHGIKKRRSHGYPIMKLKSTEMD